MNPGVFLSYSRDDFKTARLVQTLLEKQGFTVWLDQESIYAGENWPKAIGEGIASQTVLMLLWSKYAADSHFVEFEWNTALALKKKIIPVLLDNTPLPVSLQAIRAIGYDSLSASVQYVQEQIQRAALQEVAPRKEVLDKLNEIQAQSSQAVVAEAKSIYQQEGWTIQGNVYQLHGSNITIHGPSDNAATAKKWYGLWQTYIALVAGALGILVILLDLPKKWREAFPTKTEKEATPTITAAATETVSLKGTILQEDNEPLRGAVVKLDKLPGDSTVTTSDGGFIFREVPGQVGENVRIYVYASGYQSRDEYKPLPGPIELHLVKEKLR
jgi:hypothetical protein